MRWILLGIFAWVLVLIQTTLVQAVTIETDWIGTIGPDLLAPLAVFIALYGRHSTDVVIAACGLGFALDLGAGGASGSLTVIGPMAIGYTLASWGLLATRDALFSKRIGTRVLLTFLFCLVAHPIWVTCQFVVAHGAGTWGAYGRGLIQATLLAGYTAMIAPPVMWLLGRLRRWIFRGPAGTIGSNRR